MTNIIYATFPTTFDMFYYYTKTFKMNYNLKHVINNIKIKWPQTLFIVR
jgi:hypothetical protein